MILNSHIKGLQHLGLPVADVEKSKKWYTEILGFNCMYETAIGSGNDAAKVAFIGLNGFVIEMYQLSGKELDEIKSRGHGHIDHFALDVDDIDALYEKLNHAGIKAIEGTPSFLPFWEKGVRFLTILGPDNEKIEFSQRL